MEFTGLLDCTSVDSLTQFTTSQDKRGLAKKGCISIPTNVQFASICCLWWEVDAHPTWILHFEQGSSAFLRHLCHIHPCAIIPKFGVKHNTEYHEFPPSNLTSIPLWHATLEVPCGMVMGRCGGKDYMGNYGSGRTIKYTWFLVEMFFWTSSRSFESHAGRTRTHL